MPRITRDDIYLVPINDNAVLGPTSPRSNGSRGCGSQLTYQNRLFGTIRPYWSNINWEANFVYTRVYGGVGMTIRKVVQVSINPGKVAEFQAAASKFIQRVESQEPNTLNYEWFLDENLETCCILESYRDDEAMLYHLENIRDLYEQLFAVCEITRLQVFGKVRDDVRAAHMPQTQFYDHWAGVTRVSAGIK